MENLDDPKQDIEYFIQLFTLGVIDAMELPVEAIDNDEIVEYAPDFSTAYRLNNEEKEY